MSSEQVVELAQQALLTAFTLAAPMLILATVVSVLISIAQVMTSIQEPTVSTVPRLAATAAAAFLMMPWIMSKLVDYTVRLFSDFAVLVR